MKRLVHILILVCVLWAAPSLMAAVSNVGLGSTGHDLDSLVLMGVAVIIVAAKIGGEIFERLGQPAVLGELVIGILIGNLALVGFTRAEPLASNAVIEALARIGVIILLFEVGLESNLSEMRKVGWSSLLVAVLGVIAPFFLGWGVAAYFIPDEHYLVHVFIGATLCATSVGITARVLKDLGQLKTREARIILGAAVIDDVLGLIILAIIKGMIDATSSGTNLSLSAFIWITAKAVLFLAGALLVGRFCVPYLLRGVRPFEGRGVLLTMCIAFCFVLAWVAGRVGLDPIVGAFAAGLVLDDLHFKSIRREKHDLVELLMPVSTLLVPIFFVLMGLKVDLRAFTHPELLGFAAALTVAAIIGKQICAFGPTKRGLNRLAIGLGMIPRGEVGLIFAGIGAALMLPNHQGVPERVINNATFGSIILMVFVTTLVTPPALKWAISRRATLSEAYPDDALTQTAEDAVERTRQ